MKVAAQIIYQGNVIRDWQIYDTARDARDAGRLYQGDDGKWWFYVGN